jgi:hypothetical protein
MQSLPACKRGTAPAGLTVTTPRHAVRCAGLSSQRGVPSSLSKGPPAKRPWPRPHGLESPAPACVVFCPGCTLEPVVAGGSHRLPWSEHAIAQAAELCNLRASAYLCNFVGAAAVHGRELAVRAGGPVKAAAARCSANLVAAACPGAQGSSGARKCRTRRRGKQCTRESCRCGVSHSRHHVYAQRAAAGGRRPAW